MLLRAFSATMALNKTTELYLTTYWDADDFPPMPEPGRPMPAKPTLSRGTQMEQKINAALDRWKAVAQLTGDRFTLEGLLSRLIRDDELAAVKINVADNHGNAAEVYSRDRWAKFCGYVAPTVVADR